MRERVAKNTFTQTKIFSAIKANKEKILLTIFAIMIVLFIFKLSEMQKNTTAIYNLLKKDINGLSKEFYDFRYELLGDTWVVGSDGKIKLDCNCQETITSDQKPPQIDINPIHTKVSESDPSYGNLFSSKNKMAYEYSLNNNVYKLVNIDTSGNDSYYQFYDLYVCNNNFCDKNLYGDDAIDCRSGNCIDVGSSTSIFAFPYNSVISGFTVRDIQIDGLPEKLLDIEAKTSNGIYRELVFPMIDWGSNVPSPFFFKNYGLWDGVFPFTYNISMVSEGKYLVEVNVKTTPTAVGVDKRYLLIFNEGEVEVNEYEL